MATTLEGEGQGQRPKLDSKSFVMRGADGKVSPYSMIGGDGKPTFAAKSRFRNSFAFIGRDLSFMGKKLHDKILPVVQRAFDEGDLDTLMEMAELTSPTNYRKTELGLGNCQVINDLAVLALAVLIGEDAVRQHQYNYQASFGQESGDVARDRMASLFGGNSLEARAEAVEILKARNPERDETPLDARLGGVHGRLMAIISEVRSEAKEETAGLSEEWREEVLEE